MKQRQAYRDREDSDVTALDALSANRNNGHNNRDVNQFHKSHSSVILLPYMILYRVFQRSRYSLTGGILTPNTTY